MASMGMPELLVVLVICAGLVVIIWPASRICRRAGFTPWLGVLAVVPIAHVLPLWFVALAKWPLAAGDNIAHGSDPSPPALETAIASALPCTPAIGA